MEKDQDKKIFYEATWFNFDETYEYMPLVRGNNIKRLIKKLLTFTRDQSGWIEVYKFTCNQSGSKYQFYSKFEVFNELKLIEN
jgi:hypothetical protein